MPSLTYLITGTAQGLGRALVAALLSRPHTTVVAAVRDVEHPNARSLNTLRLAEGSKVIVVKIDSLSTIDLAAAIQQLQKQHGIDTLDVVIANAGISASFVTVADAQAEKLLEHFQVNAVGVVQLYQATRPLLLRSTNPKFIVSSGSGGSIAQQERIRGPIAEYGPSRAAVNWLFRKVHFEEPKIASVLVDPGLLDTESGRSVITRFGIDPKVLQPLDVAVEAYLLVVDRADKQTYSGQFINAADGAVLDW